ncbi:hypothetical protein Dimus_005138 [Dionaea muscipula]
MTNEYRKDLRRSKEKRDTGTSSPAIRGGGIAEIDNNPISEGRGDNEADHQLNIGREIQKSKLGKRQLMVTHQGRDSRNKEGERLPSEPFKDNTTLDLPAVGTEEA